MLDNFESSRPRLVRGALACCARRFPRQIATRLMNRRFSLIRRPQTRYLNMMNLILLMLMTWVQFQTSLQGELQAPIATSYSLHACVGETNTLRSCHFRNLFLRVADRQWVYFQSPDDPPRIKVAGQSLSSTNFSAATAQEEDRYFIQSSFIHVAAHGDQNREISITPVVEVGAPPTHSSAVRDIQGLSVLWEFTANSAYSYGHFMLNDWFPMFLTMQTHQEKLPSRFNVFSHSPTVPSQDEVKIQAGALPRHTGAHYISAWSKNPVKELDVLIQEAKAAGQEWVRFSDIIMGNSGYLKAAEDLIIDGHDMPNAPSMFNTLNWRSFRNAVYAAFELPVPGTKKREPQRQQSILIVMKPQKDWRRQLLNQNELKEHLSVVFPNVSTTIVDLGLMTPLQQLKVMSETDVMISMQGSSAFRLVFMGKGSKVIFIGNPTDPSKAPSEWAWTAFFEVPRYFAMADVQFLKYHVNSSNVNEFTWNFRAYEACVRVNVLRMEELVRQALWENLAEGKWNSEMNIRAQI